MIRNAEQLKEVSDNSKSWIHQVFEDYGFLANKGILPQTDEIPPLQIRSSNLIYLLDNPYSSVIQKNKAADELSRLVVDFNSQSGVFEDNMFSFGVFW